MLYLFDDFSLDANRRELRRGSALLPLEPQVFDLLQFLVRNRDRVVSKDDLLASVWGGRIVSEATLGSRISTARRVLGDDGEQQRLIRTIIGKGVRFVGAVRELESLQETSGSERLAIVVLPLVNLSGDVDLEYFVDRITENLTTDLSRTPEWLVISRSTAFTYKGKPVDAKRVGHELGVHYILQGSVWRTESQLHLNAQLVDARSGGHLWVDRFETFRHLEAAEAEIVGRLAWNSKRNLFAVASRRAEQSGQSDSEASILALRGWALYHLPRSEANMQEALRLWELALEIDPRSMSARIGVALALVSNLWYGWRNSFQKDGARAEKLLSEVFATNANDITARVVMGILRRVQGRLNESKMELETAIAIDPDVAGLRQLGSTLVYLGELNAAIQFIKKSTRLSPYDSNTAFNYTHLGLGYLLLNQAQKAIDFLEKARTLNPRVYIVHLYLAGALGLTDDVDEARIALAEGIRLKPEIRSLEMWHTYRPWERNSQYLALRKKTLDIGLCRAGLPSA